MRIGHTQRARRSWGGALLAALVLMVAPVVPAAADHAPTPDSPVAGSGRLEGTELVEDQGFLGQPCFLVDRHVFGLQGEGTFKGRTPDGQEVVYRAQLAEGQAVHQGPLKVEAENTEQYTHGPNGTHGTDTSCSVPTGGTPVPAKFKVYAAEQATDTDGDSDIDVLGGAAWVYRLDGGGAKVPCTGTGTYVRKGAYGDNWHADWALDADCTVVGNDPAAPGEGVSPARTTITHLGYHGPCGGGCVDNFKVDYNQYPPVPGLAVSLGGPASGPAGQTVTVTAGVADSGVPVSGAAVAFTVSGPGPAAPAGGSGATGADGRAGFTFTAAVEGDYVVTASATSATYPGQVVTDTHTVRFVRPAPVMTLQGLSRTQTDDPVTVVATIVDTSNPVPGDPPHDPVPGVPVEFTITGPGKATPASKTVPTDAQGRAPFTFSGDRAGEYTVSASATYATQDMAATHPVRLDVKTMTRAGALTLPEGERNLTSSVVDSAGRYAYYGTNASTAQVVKVDLATFERVSTLTLPDGGSLASAVIDPAGNYAYFGTGLSPQPGRVIKIDLNTFQRVGAITLAAAEFDLASAVIDPAGRYAYFGTNTRPGRVVKIDLANFQRVDAITLEANDRGVSQAMIDPAGRYAYFATVVVGPAGRVVKVDLATFQRVGEFNVADDEDRILSAVIAPDGEFAYLAVEVSPSGGGGARAVKVNLRTLERVAAFKLPDGVYGFKTAVMDPAGGFAYFSANRTGADDEAFRYSYIGSNLVYGLAVPPADAVVKVDLASFELAHILPLPSGEDGITSAVMAPDGSSAYFGTSPPSLTEQAPPPSKVVKVSLTRPPNPLLVAADDGTDPAYATDYGTALSVPAPGVLGNDKDTGDGDPLTAGQASDPAGGSVTLNPDGSFTYTPHAGFSGADTFTYTASDGKDYSAPATVTVKVGAPPDGVSSVKGNAFGYLSDVSLFGGPTQRRGFGQVTCTAPNTPAGCAPETAESPSVELPTTGGSLSDTDPDGATAQYGPATIFSSGRQQVTSQGSTGPGGSVSTSTEIANVNSSGDEVFTASALISRCSASESGLSGKTTITGGTLRVSEGDPNVEGDDTVVTVPAEPEANTSYEGQIEGVGDHFRYVFNEQVRNPDGSITVYAAHQYLLGPTAIGHLYIGKSECGVTATAGPMADAVADFDGDGATDVSVFRPSTGVWYLRQSTGGDRATEFGTDGDVPVPGDYDGDGTTDLGVYRPSNNVWYLRQSTGGDSASQFGAAGDVPVPGDYDGDGTTDLGVYRPSTGVWYLRQSTAGDRATQFGAGGDVAVPGDYDGDGTTDLGVFRPSTGVWYARQSTDGDRASDFGVDGDVPVPGDYDGDGTTDLGVYRPATGTWYLRRSTGGDTASGFGVDGDVPVPGDYDGDGTTDLGVHRPSTNVWYLRRSTTGDTATQFGAPSDIPLPLPAAIRQDAAL